MYILGREYLTSSFPHLSYAYIGRITPEKTLHTLLTITIELDESVEILALSKVRLGLILNSVACHSNGSVRVSE